MESHYDVLGVSPDADVADVRRAYRALLKDHHPDQGGSRERFMRITDAYESITGESVPMERETDGGAVAYGSAAGAADYPTYDVTDSDPTPDRRHDGHGLTVEGQYLSLSLTALVQEMDLASLVGRAVPANANRTVAFFEVRNASSHVLSWRGREHTSFIGDDGFLYQGSNIVRPHVDRLPDRWCGTDVDLLPGRGLDAVVVAQGVPAGVTIEKVVYTQHVRERGSDDIADTERYLFEIKPRVRDTLDYPPFDDE